MQVTIDEAKERLADLIEAALKGNNIEIAAAGNAIVRLVAIRRTPFKFDILKDELSGDGPDFFEPMGEEELALWEGGR